MSFLSGLGGGMASGLAGGLSAIGGGGNPLAGAMGGLSGIAGNPMSGIGILKSLFGGGGGGGESEAAKPNAAASGLGKLIGVDPAKISSIASSIGGGMNQIAQAGGAQAGYAAPPQAELPAINNHMQMMDPKILQALVQYFQGQRQ